MPPRKSRDEDLQPLVSHSGRFEMDDDMSDDDPLLPESDLYIERLRNELQYDLAGADAYERTLC
jgi:hypothetical protein